MGTAAYIMNLINADITRSINVEKNPTKRIICLNVNPGVDDIVRIPHNIREGKAACPELATSGRLQPRIAMHGRASIPKRSEALKPLAAPMSQAARTARRDAGPACRRPGPSRRIPFSRPVVKAPAQHRASGGPSGPVCSFLILAGSL